MPKKNQKRIGYYKARLSTAASPKELMAGNYMLRSISKAKNTDHVIYTMESFEQYPDLHYATLDFKKSIRLTHVNVQRELIVSLNR